MNYTVINKVLNKASKAHRSLCTRMARCIGEAAREFTKKTKYVYPYKMERVDVDSERTEFILTGNGVGESVTIAMRVVYTERMGSYSEVITLTRRTSNREEGDMYEIKKGDGESVRRNVFGEVKRDLVLKGKRLVASDSALIKWAE